MAKDEGYPHDPILIKNPTATFFARVEGTSIIDDEIRPDIT